MEVTEVPDADKLDQIRPATLEDGEDGERPTPPQPPRPGDDVPEADAVEQSIEVPIDDEDYA
ncbi:MAG: hypothetical protein HOV79_26810 [Hamadaea sp.]|nr:hypothetical protein [Hamadaea sp.]